MDPSAASRERELIEDFEALRALRRDFHRFDVCPHFKAIQGLIEVEARLVVDGRFSLDARRKMQGERGRARARRMGVQRELFEQLLFKLDYEDQARLFARAKRLSSVRDARVFSIALSGRTDDGLRWLHRRLYSDLFGDAASPTPEDAPPEDAPRSVNYAFGSAFADDVVGHMLGRVGEAVEIDDPEPTPRAVLEKVCEEWQSRSVVFTFTGIDRLGADGWESVVQRFWRPLVTLSEERRAPSGSARIVAFFLLEGDFQPPAGTVAVDEKQGFEPGTPLLLPPLSPFDEARRKRWSEGVKKWLTDYENDLPLDLAHLDDAAARLSGKGSPRDTISAICRDCGYAFNHLHELWP